MSGIVMEYFCAQGRTATRVLLLPLFIVIGLSGCGGGDGYGSGSGALSPGGSSSSAATLSWNTAQVIENNAGAAGYTDIAANSAGNAFAVWMQSDGTSINIWANRYVAGTGWLTAQLLESASGNAEVPQIAIDASGNAIAVWDQLVGTTNHVYANRYVVGSGWQGAIEIDATINAGAAIEPQITIDTAGNATAVWQQDDTTTGTSRIFANRYTSTGWQGASAINSNVGNADSAQVVVDMNANVTAIWAQSDGTYYSLYANRYIAGNGWAGAQLIETSIGDVSVPHLSSNATGTVVAVWPQANTAGGSTYSIWANRYVVGSGWGTAQLIETGSGDADVPQVVVDANNNATAVWTQSDGTRYNIWSNRMTSGSWGTAQLIETANAGNADFPSVTVDNTGNVIAVWQQFDGAKNDIYSNRYVAGSAWGGPQLVEAASGDALAPQVVVDTNGGIMAVWEQNDGTAYSIWSNRGIGL